LITEACTHSRQRLAAQGVDLILDVPPELQADVDRRLLGEAIELLVQNALDAMPHGGELTITGVATGEGVEVEIADSGAGLTDQVRHHLFEPFFSTKPGRSGTGLTTVRQIVQAQGGSVTAADCPDGGAAFTLHIPRRPLRAAA
jgi:two-component system sensor histidine kinase HydH